MDLRERGTRIIALFEDTILETSCELKPPAELAAEARLLRELAAGQHGVLRGLVEAAHAGDVPRVRALAERNRIFNARAVQLARRLGAKSCAGDRR